ncbi:hypothetical protein ACP70R_005932 [Stipagrostis hirtigluma subsp. patula]
MVIFRGTHWLRFWAMLQRSDDNKEAIKTASRAMEILVMQIFAWHGWRFSHRICAA